MQQEKSRLKTNLNLQYDIAYFINVAIFASKFSPVVNSQKVKNAPGCNGENVKYVFHDCNELICGFFVSVQFHSNINQER